MAGLNSDSKMLLHFNGSDGDIFTEDSAERHNFLTFYNNAQIDTAEKKFGTSSCLFDGVADRISLRNTIDWDWFETNENGTVWTIDFWVKHAALPGEVHYIGQIFNDDNWISCFYSGNEIGFNFRKTGSTTSEIRGGVLNDSTWHHICWVIIANGSTKTIGGYLDGVQVAYGTDNAIGAFDCVLEIGSSDRSPSAYGVNSMDGNIDEMRVQKSNYFSLVPDAGKTDSFTPPISEYSGTPPIGGYIDGTVILSSAASGELLSHFDGSNGSNNIIDATLRHTLTAVATAQLSTSQKKWGTASLSLDGNSDYVDITDNLSDFDVHASTLDDWTIQCWSRPAGLNTHLMQAFLTNDQNAWNLSVMDGPGWFYGLYVGNVQKIDLRDTGNPTLNQWYHVAMCKVGNEYGLYVGGIQVDYDKANDTLSGINGVHIGASYAPAAYFNGYLDEFRIENFNRFDAAPDIGNTDTIIVPTEAYPEVTVGRPQSIIIT